VGKGGASLTQAGDPGFRRPDQRQKRTEQRARSSQAGLETHEPGPIGVCGLCGVQAQYIITCVLSLLCPCGRWLAQLQPQLQLQLPRSWALAGPARIPLHSVGHRIRIGAGGGSPFFGFFGC
jgi:hypothetical protein